jgi:hypothetical protein
MWRTLQRIGFSASDVEDGLTRGILQNKPFKSVESIAGHTTAVLRQIQKASPHVPGQQQTRVVCPEAVVAIACEQVIEGPTARKPMEWTPRIALGIVPTGKLSHTGPPGASFAPWRPNQGTGRPQWSLTNAFGAVRPPRAPPPAVTCTCARTPPPPAVAPPAQSPASHRRSR